MSQCLTTPRAKSMTPVAWSNLKQGGVMGGPVVHIRTMQLGCQHKLKHMACTKSKGGGGGEGEGACDEHAFGAGRRY